MSFHVSVNKKEKNKKFVSPDVPQTRHWLPHAGTFLPSFRGSLTIEAALSLPIFLFFSVVLIHFLILIFLQSDIAFHIDEAARDIGKRAYIADENEITSLLSANSLTIRSAILDDELRKRVESSQIRNGTSGFHTMLSSYDEGSGRLDLIVTYTYDFPFLPKDISGQHFEQHCYCRSWIGLYLAEDDASSDSSADEEGRSVYVTPTGSAYHLSPSCPYLDLSIHSVSKDTVFTLRNESGAKYTKCSCVDPSCSTVYITDYGTMYHSSLDCSNLKRTVTCIDISEVGGRHICPKCAASGN